MNLSKLLRSRQALLRQAQLANLAYAYQTLQRLATRIAAANLRGLVRLRPADPDDECYWASLVALEGNQSLIEEHFADRELIDLCEAIEFATDSAFDELEFRIETLAERFVTPLRETLEQEGIVFDTEGQPNLAADSAD